MVFQLMRYLAKKGLGPLSEGESQALEGYMESNQRSQSLELIRNLMVQHHSRRRMTGSMGEPIKKQNQRMGDRPPKGKQKPIE